MNSFYIQHTHSDFHYRKYGSGQKLVFAFHGYGRDSYTFYFLEKHLGKTHTIIAIDLPFHGLTEWDKELTFHPEYLVQVIQEIRKQQDKLNEQFVLMGFSMGGRIALHLAQIMHKHVDRLVLVAPDGLKVNFWHWLATRTWGGNKLMHHTINHPQWLQKTLGFAERTGMITKSIAGFVHYYVDDEEQRLILFRRWTTMRKFVPNLTKLKRLIKKQKMQVRMLFGKHDKVILYTGGQHFIQGIEDLARVRIIESGHNLLHEFHGRQIASMFTD
ncbi:alpha/beta fold hydrolase [Aridibaculum aurantiacum]|uniref:alpha/beta fold hydrolase n=1 Tax=Aridibaculum aurantiacum TaxID=2810307 RepID=UPI001A97023C|nr:alpha/beta hydrolase [Aridibaculum aurantiacum]